MKHRVYLPLLAEGAGDPRPGERIVLDSDRSHYLHRVLRLKAGAVVGLLDGRGGEWQATLNQSDPRSVEVEVGELTRREPPPTPLILAQALLKGGAMDLVVQKATELGATGIWAFNAERSNMRLDQQRLANRLGHWQRIAISAMEQCESSWLPTIRSLNSFDAVLADADATWTILMLDLAQSALTTGSIPEPTVLLVGPEGGWSEAERSLASARAGVRAVGLGELTLRAETAPLAALAAIRHSWAWRR